MRNLGWVLLALIFAGGMVGIVMTTIGRTPPNPAVVVPVGPPSLDWHDIGPNPDGGQHVFTACTPWGDRLFWTIASGTNTAAISSEPSSSGSCTKGPGANK